MFLLEARHFSDERFTKWAIIKGYLKDKDDTTIIMGDWNATPNKGEN